MKTQGNYKELYSDGFEAYDSPWDTDYFGILSAKAVLNGTVTEQELVILKDFLDEYEFATIINSGNNKQNNYWLGRKTNAFLTDINVQLTKDLSTGFIKSIEPGEVYESYHRDENVLRIAHHAFKHSRFFNDPNLPLDKAKVIYVHWAENAFNKPGRYYSITKNQGVTTGFILFSLDQELSIATIELIAVDEQYRGLGVGKKLISGMESFISQRNIGKIKVGTQIDNASAIRFYTSCGFIYTTCNAIYHYWPNR